MVRMATCEARRVSEEMQEEIDHRERVRDGRIDEILKGDWRNSR